MNAHYGLMLAFFITKEAFIVVFDIFPGSCIVSMR